jgi:hypothetical protein
MTSGVTDLEPFPAATCAELLDNQCSPHLLLGTWCCTGVVNRRCKNHHDVHDSEMKLFRR